MHTVLHDYYMKTQRLLENKKQPHENLIIICKIFQCEDARERKKNTAARVAGKRSSRRPDGGWREPITSGRNKTSPTTTSIIKTLPIPTTLISPISTTGWTPIGRSLLDAAERRVEMFQRPSIQNYWNKREEENNDLQEECVK